MISVIIPTYKRKKVLRECLGRLGEQGVDEIVEVLVTEDEKHVGPGVLRNEMILMAKGEILIFINDDTMVADDFIKRHVEFHRKHQEVEVAVCGPFVTEKGLVEGKVMRWLVYDSEMHFAIPKNSGWVGWNYFWTCNLSIKRDFLIENKLFFDKDFRVAAWEDVEFGYRAGLKGLRLFFDQQILAEHRHSFEMRDLWRRFFAHGRGLKVIGEKVPVKYLPPLAKWYYRLLARMLLVGSGYYLTRDSLKKWLAEQKKLNNVLMQYLVIGEKLSGFDYESKLSLSRD